METQLDPNDYTIAWIAPLTIEKLAAKHMLDKVHAGLFPDDNGDYSYLAGTMCGHNIIRAEAPDDLVLFDKYYKNMKDREHPDGGTFCDPGQDHDVLHGSDDEVVARTPRPDKRRTRVWYGPIGSGESLVKNPEVRDGLRDKYNVYGLEMEAAGVRPTMPMAVIRGVSDYADEHKNDVWQPYAAAMAAAYAKAVLSRIPVARAVPSKAVPEQANSRRKAKSATDDGDDDDDGEEFADRGGKVSVNNNVRGANNKFYSGHFNGATFYA
ncbi:hypothetical protein LLEC1_06710 [Akanthomyces lecanii]|uniref:Nucleoside phosphorylase domain-containing protein n=1 Tax=Cordyceps confragosa TaxID=2714763 RepID=A0A179I8Q6_CORDF|nr:hypothetical protein LLEC1_06710 [Akanthomyces lecanii]